jgi:hypothetical protein
MEQSLRLSPKGKLSGNKQKNKEEKLGIEKAYFLGGFTILIFFNNGVQKQINFLPIFARYVKGEFTKYATSQQFKKFIVRNGNIYWGRNEDVIFPVSYLYNSTHSKRIKEEVLLVL